MIRPKLVKYIENVDDDEILQMSENEYINLAGLLAEARIIAFSTIRNDRSSVLEIDRLRSMSDDKLTEYMNGVQEVIDLLVESHSIVGNIGRRKNHELQKKASWDILDEKCRTDPLVAELWQEIQVLLKLEED